MNHLRITPGVLLLALSMTALSCQQGHRDNGVDEAVARVNRLADQLGDS
jgi:hypothetical protein